jgi:hypothetical protein
MHMQPHAIHMHGCIDSSLGCSPCLALTASVSSMSVVVGSTGKSRVNGRVLLRVKGPEAPVYIQQEPSELGPAAKQVHHVPRGQ